MPKYTTGELAKLCNVSVRTVQYYDDRGILVPSELSEGGRRLYNEGDLKRMRIICFLREAGLSLNNIATLLTEKDPEGILALLLEQQEQALRDEVSERQAKLSLIDGIKRELKGMESFSVEAIGDIAHVMKQKRALSHMRWGLLLSGIPVSALQWTAIALWITNGLWWLLLIWGLVAIPWGIGISRYYFRAVSYICPQCHTVFRPRFKEAFWAYHTPKMRRLTCPRCSCRGLCIEVRAERRGDHVD